VLQTSDDSIFAIRGALFLQVYLKHELDYESTKIYLLSLTANDRGPDSLPAHASLIIRVDDVNDNAPQINVNTLTSLTYAEVRENAEVGTFVAHLSVIDADSGDNGRFSCSVDDVNFLLQHIYASELKVEINNQSCCPPPPRVTPPAPPISDCTHHNKLQK